MRNELAFVWNLLETCWELHFHDEEDGLYAIHILGFRSDVIRQSRAVTYGRSESSKLLHS